MVHLFYSISPTTYAQIAEVEVALSCELPYDIKNLLLEMDGDNWFVFSTEQIIETNTRVHEPLERLLFIAGNGGGDYFGHPITRDDGVLGDLIFLWEHEFDNRMWKADCLEDAMRKYYSMKKSRQSRRRLSI